MKNISLLDCTLRDGGHVNNFDFGKQNIKRIINNLSLSGVDIIELGFIMNVVNNPNKTLFNNAQDVKEFIEDTDDNQTYSMMIRPDWYDISNLSGFERIKMLRFAFHKKDLDLTFKQADIARRLGYKVFLNPVNVTGYTKKDLESLLIDINKFEPNGVSIVDTFGALLEDDLLSIHDIFENNLNLDVTIGVHLHENLSLSFSLAQKFLEIRNKDRDVIIDTSVLGMGRIPGNLPTELMMQLVNKKYGKDYLIEKVLEVADKPISLIKKKIPWGYSPEYAFTALNRMHRSYAEYLVNDLGISLDKAIVILTEISKTNHADTLSQELAYSIVKTAN